MRPRDGWGVNTEGLASGSGRRTAMASPPRAVWMGNTAHEASQGAGPSRWVGPLVQVVPKTRPSWGPHVHPKPPPAGLGALGAGAPLEASPSLPHAPWASHPASGTREEEAGQGDPSKDC